MYAHMYESEPSLPTPHPTPHTCAHTHSQTHTNCAHIVCVCVRARAHACVCRCGVQGIQYYVYILFLKFYVRIFLDLVKCSVPILIGEISAIKVTTITLLYYYYTHILFSMFSLLVVISYLHVMVRVCLYVCVRACVHVSTVFLFKSMN